MTMTSGEQFRELKAFAYFILVPFIGDQASDFLFCQNGDEFCRVYNHFSRSAFGGYTEEFDNVLEMIREQYRNWVHVAALNDLSLEVLSLIDQGKGDNNEQEAR